MPSSLEGIADVVRTAYRLRIEGPPSDLHTLRLEMYRGVTELHPADQVVAVRAGTPLADIQAALQEHGLCLPFGPSTPGSPHGVGIGRLLAANLPHTLESQCGTWRDWVIGMTVVLADGTVAKSGSMAVKSVAGYDVHKLFIGSRGRLGVIADVILRAYPVAALPQERVETIGVPLEIKSIRRGLRSNWEKSLSCVSSGIIDHASCTIWSDEAVPSSSGTEGWTISLVEEADPSSFGDVNAQHWMKRAAMVFDPDGKFA